MPRNYAARRDEKNTKLYLLIFFSFHEARGRGTYFPKVYYRTRGVRGHATSIATYLVERKVTGKIRKHGGAQVSMSYGQECNESGHLQFRQRPYSVECTRSHPNSAVNRQKARSVLGWGTAWEALGVPLAFYFLPKNTILSIHLSNCPPLKPDSKNPLIRNYPVLRKYGITSR